MYLLNENGEKMLSITFLNSSSYYQIEKDRVQIQETLYHKPCEDGMEEWVDLDVISTETGEILMQFHGNKLHYFSNSSGCMIEF